MTGIVGVCYDTHAVCENTKVFLDCVFYSVSSHHDILFMTGPSLFTSLAA